MKSYNDGYLEHYGVKGMRWGYRNDPKNSRYSEKARAEDRLIFGKKGEKRINRRMNNGDTHKKATRKEVGRQLGEASAKAAIGLGITIATPYIASGVMRVASNRAAARGAAEAARILADNRGLTSYQTISLAFDQASQSWRL